MCALNFSVFVPVCMCGAQCGATRERVQPWNLGVCQTCRHQFKTPEEVLLEQNNIVCLNNLALDAAW